MLIQTLRLWRSNDIDTTFSTRKYESWSEGSLKWSEDEETSVYTFVIIFAKKAVGEVRDPWNTGTEETFKLLPPAGDHILLVCGCEYCIYGQQFCPLTGRICVDLKKI